MTAADGGIVHESVRRLDGSCTDPSALGGKGAALDRLVAWGIPVPPTAVVTVAATRVLEADPAVAGVVARVRRGDVVPAVEVDAAFRSVRWPEALVRSVTQVAVEIGAGRPVAVRSSATVEDLAASSFAGQYHSVLDVDPADAAAVLDAVASVAASLWHPAPCAYRRALGVDDDGAGMAALVMAMVPARCAGVVFTEDPGGASGSARVEWVAGLADVLVSGRQTPSARVVLRIDPDGDGLPPEVREAVRLALDVEARDGRPQDVEWAWDGTRVWVVQARPITVSGPVTDGFDDDPDVLDRLDLTTAGIGEMVAGVLPPLRWDLNRVLVGHAFEHLLAGLGVVVPADAGPLLRRVRGRAALDFGRLQAMADALPGAAGDELEAQYFGSRRAERPSGARTVAGHRRHLHLRHDLRALAVRSRAVLDADIAVAAVDGLTALEPLRGDESVSTLAARRLWCIDLALRALAAELAVAADAAAGFGRLEALLGRRVDAATAASLAARYSLPEPAPAPSVGASAAVFAGPTWAELGRTPPTPPSPAVRSVASFHDAMAVAGVRTDGLRSRLWQRAVRRLADDVAEQLRRRELTKRAVLELGGAVRQLDLAIGRRLVADGVLADAGSIELLSADEFAAVLAGGPPPGPEVLRRRRRAVRSYELEAPLPVRFRGLPRPEPVTVAPGAARLDGWAASPGRAEGRARVVRDPGETFENGEVLVAAATDPSWSPLFVRAAAIVLERGGPLSHAAILARELGVPAVLNVPRATAVLDGLDVVVDGSTGVVAVEARAVDARAGEAS
jgi:phosphohistidine swiveling domain-containing protein